MDCVVYTEPQRACPRFDYSVRQLDSLTKRIRTFLNDIDVPFVFDPPDFTNIQIRVVSLCSSGKSLDLKDLIQKPNGESKTQNVDKGDIDDRLPILLILYVDSEPDDLKKINCTNVIIVSEKEDVIAALHAKVKECSIDSLCISKINDLKRNVANILERVVFRSISDLVPMVRGLLEFALDTRILQDYFKESIRCLVESWVDQKSILKFMEDEFFAEHQRYGLDFITESIPLTKEIKDKFAGLKNELPYLTFACKENAEGKFLWYYLIYYMAKATTQCICHTVANVCNGIPKVVRPYFKISSIEEEYETLVTNFFAILSPYFARVDKEPYNVEHFQAVLRRNKLTISYTIQKFINELPQIDIFASQLEELKTKTQTLRGFQGEIAGMYNRSDVPQHERPISPTPNRKLSGNVTDDLFKGFATIKGCGYRYGRLTIFYDTEDDKKGEIDRINSHIHTVLSKHGITEYDVTPATKSIKHFKKVGAKIKLNNRCGTLGGFANMTPPHPRKPILCALLSKHVVNGSNEVYMVDNGGSIEIGIMVQSTGEANQKTLIDVAAARILDKHQENCETSFKNSSGEYRNGKLYDIPGDGFLSGLPVHIYGAMTGPGRGIITIPQYTVNETTGAENRNFMIIEDIREDREIALRFSTEGDSGSIICADDRDDEYVHVISMLVGCSNYDDIKKDATKAGKYFCFRMTSALDKLREETGYPFSLCNSHIE